MSQAGCDRTEFGAGGSTNQSWTAGLVRVVHLVSPQRHGDEGVLACREVLACGNLSNRVCVVGTRSDAERVRRLGVGVDAVLPALASFGVREQSVRREVSSLVRHASGPWVVCSWGAELAMLGRSVAALGAEGRVIVETRGPSGREDCTRDGVVIGGADVRRGFEDATFVGAGDWVASAWEGAGAKDVRTAPIVFGSAMRSGERRRDRHGAQSEPGERSQVVGLLADPASLGDARQFVFVLGLLYAAGLKVDGLVPTGARHARRAARFVRDHGRRWGLREWTGPVHELAVVCDALVCPAACEQGDGLAAGPVVLAAAGGAGGKGRSKNWSRHHRARLRLDARACGGRIPIGHGAGFTIGHVRFKAAGLSDSKQDRIGIAA